MPRPAKSGMHMAVPRVIEGGLGRPTEDQFLTARHGRVQAARISDSVRAVTAAREASRRTIGPPRRCVLLSVKVAAE